MENNFCELKYLTDQPFVAKLRPLLVGKTSSFYISNKDEYTLVFTRLSVGALDRHICLHAFL